MFQVVKPRSSKLKSSERHVKAAAWRLLGQGSAQSFSSLEGSFQLLCHFLSASVVSNIAVFVRAFPHSGPSEAAVPENAFKCFVVAFISFL